MDLAPCLANGELGSITGSWCLFQDGEWGLGMVRRSKDV